MHAEEQLHDASTDGLSQWAWAGTTYTCSQACRAVHRACRGCGVLEGPDHEHVLRDGYCAVLLSVPDAGTRAVVPVLIGNSCWRRYVAGHSPDAPSMEPVAWNRSTR